VKKERTINIEGHLPMAVSSLSDQKDDRKPGSFRRSSFFVYVFASVVFADGIKQRKNRKMPL
jgi:hypothetical protein